MAEWMRESLDDEDIDAYNIQMQTNDPRIIKAAVKAMNARFRSEANIEGEGVGGTGGAGSSNRFESRKEMADAINAVGSDGKRRYDTDPAYRQEVIRKIGNSRRAGIAL